MNWVDIVCLAILLKSAVEGFSRGLILSAFKTAGVMVGLYVGIFYRDPAVAFLKRYLNLEQSLSALLTGPVGPGGTTRAVGALGLSGLLDMAQAAVGFFLVFAAVQLAFLVPAYFLEGIVKMSRLSGFNRLLGLLFGVARSVLVIAMVSAVLTPFVMAWPGSWLEKSLSGSYVLTRMKFLDFISPVVVKFI